MNKKEARDYLDWLRSLERDDYTALIRSCKVKLPSDDFWKRSPENRLEKAWRRLRQVR